MRIIYQSVETIPPEMRLELSKAKTADIAELIYQAWADRCFVEPRSRAAVWMDS